MEHAGQRGPAHNHAHQPPTSRSTRQPPITQPVGGSRLREDLPDPAVDEPDHPTSTTTRHVATGPRTPSWPSPGSSAPDCPRGRPPTPRSPSQLDRAYEADTAPVPPERIHALNEQAAAFYQGCYPGSWSAAYLAARLGVDPTTDPSIRPGHAPAAWTALTEHLRRHGATDEELLAAGLAKTASTGRLIDTFRDRLILPIHTTTPTGTSVIVGFVARRNPRHDQHDNPTAGPEVPQHPAHRRLHQRRAPVRGRRRPRPAPRRRHPGAGRRPHRRPRGHPRQHPACRPGPPGHRPDRQPRRHPHPLPDPPRRAHHRHRPRPRRSRRRRTRLLDAHRPRRRTPPRPPTRRAGPRRPAHPPRPRPPAGHPHPRRPDG